MEQAPKAAEAPQAKGKKTWVVIAAVVIIAIVIVAALYVLRYPPFNTSDLGTPVAIVESSPPSCGTIQNCYYDPAVKNITVNTKVTWTNNGQNPHTATTDPSASPASPVSFDSGTIAAGGATWSYTFAQTGTYKYYCSIHPFMKAEVRVT